MSSARNSITRAIGKYGSTVQLIYKPAANLDVSGDWPDPDSPTLGPPDPKSVKAVVAPEEDEEDKEGVRERVVAVFLPATDLNEVDIVMWQGNEYKIQFGDTYELADEHLAQVVTLMRVKANVEHPYG